MRAIQIIIQLAIVVVVMVGLNVDHLSISVWKRAVVAWAIVGVMLGFILGYVHAACSVSRTIRMATTEQKEVK